MRKLDLIGQRYGRLLVLSDAGKTKNGGTKWLCKCDCGKELEVFIGHLRNGNTKSCGCHSRELFIQNVTTHGEAKNGVTTPEYDAWRGAKDRCYNPNYEGFHNYGGRGIKMCERWVESFDNFLIDMGRRPSKNHSLDRYPDMNGDYRPDNCRWATIKQQQNNKTTNVFYEYDGLRLTQTQWAEKIGMNYKKFHSLVKRHSFDHVIRMHAKYGDVDRRTMPSVFYKGVVRNYTPPTGGDHQNARKIIQLDKRTGKKIKLFDSIADARRELGISCMEKALKDQTKSAGGFKWKYAT